MNSAPTVGVFALQGDVREHLAALDRAGVNTLAVKRPEELARCHAMVLPGGESTTMSKLARTFELFDPLADRIRGGMPTFGTCAGMIMLAEKIEDGILGQETFGGLDIVVRRNAFGRQVDSFETELEYAGLDEPVHAVFIRAPWVESIGSGVEVLARIRRGEADGRIVAVRQRNIMATSFHPEMSGDDRVHRSFVEFIAQS